mgnify:CR=1 FL=1
MALLDNAARLPAPAEIGRILAREGIRAELTPVAREKGGARDAAGSRDAPEELQGADGEGPNARTYAVTVWGLEAVDMARSEGDPFFRAGPPDPALARHLSRTAARALYALGLESGQVLLGVDPGGRARVRGISAEPHPVTAEGEFRLAEAARRQAELREEESRRPPAAILGADPEFVLLTPEGRVAPASRYFPPGATVGSDSLVVHGIRRWPLAELRPAPAAEPAALAGVLRRLLAEAARRTGDEPLTWRAGALPVPGLPLGGHIHFSGVAPTPGRLRALDNAVPAASPAGAARRRRTPSALRRAGRFPAQGARRLRIPHAAELARFAGAGLRRAGPGEDCRRRTGPDRPSARRPGSSRRVLCGRGRRNRPRTACSRGAGSHGFRAENGRLRQVPRLDPAAVSRRGKREALERCGGFAGPLAGARLGAPFTKYQGCAVSRGSRTG